MVLSVLMELSGEMDKKIGSLLIVGVGFFESRSTLMFRA